MTETPQKRRDAKTKYTEIAQRQMQILLDKAATPGYYGKESLVLCSEDGILTHVDTSSHRTHKH